MSKEEKRPQGKPESKPEVRKEKTYSDKGEMGKAQNRGEKPSTRFPVFETPPPTPPKKPKTE